MALLPSPVSDLDLAFGGDMAKLMPKRETVPAEFREFPGRTKWHQFFCDLFYTGVTTSGLVPKPGIDAAVALRHVRAVACSFQPKHEHKEAAVAYLLSLWFEESSTWEKTKGGK